MTKLEIIQDTADYYALDFYKKLYQKIMQTC